MTKLSLYTMIFPRLEVFFLEEWISHHLDLGVDHIYIYNNGFLSVHENISNSGHRKLNQDEVGVKWQKKPDADYFLEYSNKEIDDKLNKIISGLSDRVTLISWQYNIDHDYGHPINQIMGYYHCSEHHLSDWWLHIDPDEYVVLYKYNSLQDLINDYNATSLLLNQRVFEKRKRNIPVRTIINWGYDLDLTKAITKTPIKKLDKINQFQQIHKVRSEYGDQVIISREDALIYHYRGSSKVSKDLCHKEFEDVKFDKSDKTMLKYI